MTGSNTGLVALPAAAYYVANNTATLALAPTNALVDLTAAAATTAGTQTVGAIKLDGIANANFGLNLTITGTLTIAGGAIMTTGTTSNGGSTRGTFLGGILNLPVETTLFQNFAGTGDWTEINSVIAGAGSLIVSGQGRLFLSSAAGANTFSGGLVVNSGNQVLFQNNAQAGTGTLTLNGGAITSNGGSATLSNPVTLNGAFAFVRQRQPNGSTVTFTGPVTMNTNAFIDTTLAAAPPTASCQGARPAARAR